MKQQFTIRTILLLFFIVGYCLGLKAQQYTIAVEANPSNGGSVYVGDQPGTTQGTYVNGQQCTVHAIPAVGYTFMVWRENGTQVSTQASYTFTVTNNRTLVANFQAQTYTISATADPTDGGSVSGGGTYNFGQSCTLAATPAIGYAFLKWTKNGTQVSTSATYTFTVTESAAYVAHFSILVTPPTVTTNAVTNATQTTATCGGNVTSDGGTSVTARGVCWSTSQNPTIADSHTTDGTGTGVFTSYITGLSSNTTYYVRAYATNSEGTAYGEQRTFTTLLSVSAPTVTTNTVTNVTQTTATCGGKVAFAQFAAPPPWLFRSDWTLMKVTRRGVGVPAEWIHCDISYNCFIMKIK